MRTIVSRRATERRLVRVDLQLEIVFVSLLVACVLLLVEYELGTAAMWSVSVHVSEEGTLAAMRGTLLRGFVISVGLGLSLAALVGFLWSFRVCRPLDRLHRLLEQMRRGNWRTASRRIPRDGLQDLREELEGVRRVACDFADEAHSVLREARSLLDEIPARDEALADRVGRAREDIVRVGDVYDRHFAEHIEPTSEIAECEPTAVA